MGHFQMRSMVAMVPAGTFRWAEWVPWDGSHGANDGKRISRMGLGGQPWAPMAPPMTHLDESHVAHGALSNEVYGGHGARWRFPMGRIGPMGWVAGANDDTRSNCLGSMV
jgi:hypothetical protein